MNSLVINDLAQMKSASELLKFIYSSEIDDLPLPIDIDDILGRVAQVKFSEQVSFDDWDKSGYIKVERKPEDSSLDHVLIWVNPSEVYERRRFTASHELGHLLYDVLPNLSDESKEELIVDKLNRDGSRNIKETRANKFAAQLLMPAQLIKREIEALVEAINKENKTATLDEVLTKLASKFAVSTIAMEYRLKALGYIQ